MLWQGSVTVNEQHISSVWRRKEKKKKIHLWIPFFPCMCLCVRAWPVCICLCMWARAGAPQAHKKPQVDPIGQLLTRVVYKTHHWVRGTKTVWRRRESNKSSKCCFIFCFVLFVIQGENSLGRHWPGAVCSCLQHRKCVHIVFCHIFMSIWR